MVSLSCQLPAVRCPGLTCSQEMAQARDLPEMINSRPFKLIVLFMGFPITPQGLYCGHCKSFSMSTQFHKAVYLTFKNPYEI